MLTFTSEAVRAHADGGGDGLDLRLAACERAAQAGVPTPEEEVWRYSRIDELDLDRFTPSRAITTVTGGDGLLVEGVAPESTDSPIDVFHDLNTAFAEPIVIRVPAGRTIADPIVVTHDIRATEAGAPACFPRLVVEAGADSDVTVVEQFVSDEGLLALCVPRLEITAAQAARVRYLGVNVLGHDTWLLGHQRSIGERDSTTLLATVSLGGDYSRVRTEARIVGQGGTTRQIALYYADGTQMHDFRTLQDHGAPKTNSDLLFKGAVQDHARSVYTGLIKIRHDAKGSVAFQTNRNLTLSAGAWAESVPNLDIETNDVKCSHASTIGPIDEEQRFYLESRGIPPRIAEQLVVLGFFDEVLEQLPVGPFAAELRNRVADKLSRHVAAVADEVAA